MEMRRHIPTGGRKSFYKLGPLEVIPKGGGNMAVVTYDGLFQFALVIIGIVGLFLVYKKK